MKLVIYVRVSSKEQVDGYSLDAQTELCKKWAAEQGHEVMKVFTEFGKSARTDKRPAFQSAISYVLAGGAEGVLVHKSDRFARNLLDFLTYQDRLKANGKQILSVSEEFLNDDSPESNFVSKIIGAVSEYVSDNIGKEAQKGRNQKAKTGAWPGSTPPLGYMREGKGKSLVPHPQHAHSLRTAFREFATGKYSLAEWANQAVDMGILSATGKKIAVSSWQRMLRNKLYIGKFDWNGEEIIGDHAAIIAQSDFDHVQEVLTRHDCGGTTNRHFWLLSGLLWSDCIGAPMHGSISKKLYLYYRVGDHHVSASELESKIEALLRKCKGFTPDAPEYLAIALKVAPNLYEVYKLLVSQHARRDFLRLIFVENGLIVSLNGGITKVMFKIGFNFIEV